MSDLPVDPAVPPISRLPDHADVLTRFVATGVRPWGGEPVTFPTGVTVLFWVLGVADALLGGWLTAVLTGALRASGWAFDVATLGGHPGVVLGMAAANVAVVTVLAVLTRGLTQASAVPLALLVAGGVCGAIALLGVAALLALTALALAVLVTVLAVVAERT